MTRFLFLALFIPHGLLAQLTYVIDQNTPVRDINDQELSMPWGGGLNATQYNTLDLNNDGNEDLVLFDRMANKVITYLQENGAFTYAPRYENLFPAEISNWLLLRDHNCDGKKDIFTGDILGMKVYTNTTQANETLSWKQVLFFSGFSGPKSQVLLTKGFSGKINLQIQFDDLPSISDADGDGDLDIFNMRFVGNGNMEFHKNFSVERYGTCDSLDFERITQAWGNFRECACGLFAYNGEACPTGGRVKHAGGKSLLALDVNGDQKQDILFAESDCARVFMFENDGTLLDTQVKTAVNFPPAHPVNFIIFPAVFYEDVDFDGKKDLMSSPNIFSKENLGANLKQSNWFYKNTGSAASPVFSFVKTNFLQEHMIDVGDNAIPAFADYDGDGDFDMFISSNSSENFRSRIVLYENTGGPKNPAFKLVVDDYLGFSNLSFYNVKIQFTDIDGDNTTDLVFTGTRFENGATDLYFVGNKSENVLDFGGQQISAINFNLLFNENLYITDVDGDGSADILAGRGNGSLEYWRNMGMPPEFNFVLEDEDIIGSEFSVLRQFATCSVADLDADGKADLVFGDQTGKIKIISDYRNAPDSDPITEVVFNPVLNVYAAQNLGGRIWPVVVNLFNSDKPAIAVGNILGGLQILRNDEGQSLPDTPVIDIYPNPVERTETLHLKTDRNATVQIISALGQKLSEPVRLMANVIQEYKVPSLAEGAYLLKFTANKKTVTRRLVIY